MKRMCRNCKNRWYTSWGLLECCMWYSMCTTEEDEIREAADCGKYEEGNPDDEDEYCPSSTNGDYSPSNPWSAPGMSMNDIARFMDDDIREKVHMEMAPCSHEEFITAYLKEDPDFEGFLKEQFGFER